MRWLTAILPFAAFLGSAVAQSRKVLAPKAGEVLTTGEKYAIRWETITGRGWWYVTLFTAVAPGKQAAEIKPLRSMGAPVEDPGTWDWTPQVSDLFIGISEYFILVQYEGGITNNQTQSWGSDVNARSDTFTLKQAGSGGPSEQSSSKQDPPNSSSSRANTPSTLSSSTRDSGAEKTQTATGEGASSATENTQDPTTGGQDPLSSNTSGSLTSGSSGSNPSSPSSAARPGSSTVPIAALVGGILGGIIVLLLIGIIVFFGRKRNWFSRSQKNMDPPTPPPLPPVIAELGKGDGPNYVIEQGLQPMDPPQGGQPPKGMNETAEKYYAELPAADPAMVAYAELPGYAPLETAVIEQAAQSGVQETSGYQPQETAYNGDVSREVAQENSAWGHSGAGAAETMIGGSQGEIYNRMRTETVAGTLADMRRVPPS